MSKTTTNSFSTFHCTNQFWRVIRACLIVGVSDGRKTTLIKDSINCCHRHDVSSLALVRRSCSLSTAPQMSNTRMPPISNSPEFDEFCSRDDDMRTPCDMSHPIHDMGGCLQLNSHYKADRCLSSYLSSFLHTYMDSAAVCLVIIVLRPKHDRGRT